MIISGCDDDGSLASLTGSITCGWPCGFSRRVRNMTGS